MADGQQYDTSQLDEVQHPTLGLLKFPKAMPPEERNGIIEGMEQKPGKEQLNLPGATPRLLQAAKPSPLTQPTQFEKEREGASNTLLGGSSQTGGGFWSNFGNAVSNVLKPRGVSPYPLMDLEAKQASAQEARAADEARKAAGRSPVYRTVAAVGSPFVNAPAMEAAADVGNKRAILGQAAGSSTVAASPLLAEGMGVLGRPALKVLGRTAKGAVEPFGIGVTGEELLKKGVSPRASALGWDQSVARAGQDLATYHKQTPIQSVPDLNEAVPKIQQTIMDNEVKPVVARHAKETLAPERMARVSQAVKESVGPFAEEFDPSAADAARGLADKMSRARTIGDVMGGPRGGLLGYVNAKLESYFAKYPTARGSDLMKNPDTAMWEAARRQLREEALDHLEQAGETGIRGARQRWGALEDIQKEVERRVNPAERQKPIGLYRMLGWMTALPTAGAGLVLGETARYLNQPDALVRRGLSKMGRSEPPAPRLLGRRGAE